MTFKQKIAFWIAVFFNLSGLFFMFSISGIFGQWFTENSSWIMPALTLLASLGIFLYTEYKNRKEKEKEFFPIITFNKVNNNNAHSWEIINYSKYPALESNLEIIYKTPDEKSDKEYFGAIINYDLNKKLRQEKKNYSFSIFMNNLNHYEIAKNNNGVLKIILKLGYKDIKRKNHIKKVLLSLNLENVILSDYDPIKGDTVETHYNIKKFIDNKDDIQNKRKTVSYKLMKYEEIS